MRRRNLLTRGGKDYSQEYFTIVAKSDGNIVFNGTASGSTTNKLQYSTDSGTTWSIALSDITVSVTSGKKVMLKGTCTPYMYASSRGIGQFYGTTADFDVEGNPMSLLFGNNFSGKTSLSGKNRAFYGLFSGCTTLQSTENLSLPATTLADYCYYGMFSSCHGLTTAPELPATTLAQGCYSLMFASCTSLTTVPSDLLPATTLTNYCYSSMFNGCRSLTTAPTLPATTLADYCYQYMFWDCTSLTTAPTLLATTLKNYCYSYMFQNCFKLSSITCLATNISATDCTYNWVSGVAPSGTFTKHPSMGGWTIGTSGIPSGWTVEDVPTPIEHDFVEIGGVKWATMNLGALSETDYGLYFQWGDTAGYPSAQCGTSRVSYKKPFNWNDYKFGNGTSASTQPTTAFTKYYGEGKTVLDVSDDAVTLHWGGDWRMPTTDEWVALGNATIFIDSGGTEITRKDKRTLLSGVTGIYLQDKTDSSKKLFFPAAGCCYGGSVSNVGSGGLYWSSSLRSSNVRLAYYMHFSSSSVGWQATELRSNGFSVRAVIDS